MNKENIFKTSKKPHVLMITNHGIHQWEIKPGLPDTGGQNVFVNQFSQTLTRNGFKITIVNRGGYTHPITGEERSGIIYKDEDQRILYLEDGLAEFVRKEDMDERLPLLCKALEKQLLGENTKIDLIISHYWDGAKLGILYNRELEKPVKHIWVPHSLGAVKKRNIDKSKWGDLRIDERIAIEKSIIQEVDQVAATSTIIRESLINDYHFSNKPLFLPPCVDTNRNYPHEIPEGHPIWAFLGSHAGMSTEEVRASLIITEVSRTDATKRKDILIKAFAEVNKEYPETMLVVTIDKTDKGLGTELLDLIKSLGIEKRTAVLGSVWNELPDIYAVTDIYCTPSVMEGFGMTSQEAAATKVPIVSSQLVPFVSEYLLGEKVDEEKLIDDLTVLKVGEGAIVVPADNVNAFSAAIIKLISNSKLRQQMAENAYRITIPYFTWENMIKIFLKESGLEKNEKGDL